MPVEGVQEDKPKLKTALRKANVKIARLQKKKVKSKLLRFQKRTKASVENKDDDWKDDGSGSEDDNDGDDDDKGNSALTQRTPSTTPPPSTPPSSLFDALQGSGLSS